MQHTPFFKIIAHIFYAFIVGTVNSCAPETPVLTPFGHAPLHSVHAGDVVVCSLSQDAHVIETKNKTITPHLVIRCNQAISFTCAPDQRLYDARKHVFVPAHELHPGDLLTTNTGSTIEIETVEIINAPREVITLSLAEPHTFYITHYNICAHNEPITMIAAPVVATEVVPIIAAYTVTAVTAVYCLKPTVVAGIKKIAAWWNGTKKETEAKPSPAHATQNDHEYAQEPWMEQQSMLQGNYVLVHPQQNNGGGAPHEPPPPTPQPPPPGGDDPDPEKPPQEKLQNNDELDPEIQKLLETDEKFKKAFEFATTREKIVHFFKKVEHLFPKWLEWTKCGKNLPAQRRIIAKVIKELTKIVDTSTEGLLDEYTVLVEHLKVTAQTYIGEGIIKIRTMFIKPT